MKLWMRLALVACLLALTTTAAAQMSEGEKKAAARAAYTEGVDLQEKGKPAEALSRFEAAQKLYDAPTHLVRIAECQALTGKWVEASETYETLAAHLTVAPDLTLVLDLETDASMSRAQARQGDAVRADWDVHDVQSRVRETYEAVVTKPDEFPLLGDVVRLDARRPRSEVLLAAWDVLRERQLVPSLAAHAEG